jgi:hypothetical protein
MSPPSVGKARISQRGSAIPLASGRLLTLVPARNRAALLPGGSRVKRASPTGPVVAPWEVLRWARWFSYTRWLVPGIGPSLAPGARVARNLAVAGCGPRLTSAARPRPLGPRPGRRLVWWWQPGLSPVDPIIQRTTTATGCMRFFATYSPILWPISCPTLVENR